MLTARAAAVIATEIFRMCPSLFVYLRDRCSRGPLRWIASREVYVGAAALTRISAPEWETTRCSRSPPLSFWRVGHHAGPRGSDHGSLPRSDKGKRSAL